MTKKGIGVSPGVAICQAVVVDAEEFDIPQRHVAAEHAQSEIERFHRAVTESRRELKELSDRTASRIGKETASIFDFHQTLLNDQTLHGKIIDSITAGQVSAEYVLIHVRQALSVLSNKIAQQTLFNIVDILDAISEVFRHGQEFLGVVPQNHRDGDNVCKAKARK